MNPDLLASLIACARQRAHLYGAVPNCPASRRRYFRELAAVARLLGDPADHFEALG